MEAPSPGRNLPGLWLWWGEQLQRPPRRPLASGRGLPSGIVEGGEHTSPHIRGRARQAFSGNLHPPPHSRAPTLHCASRPPGRCHRDPRDLFTALLFPPRGLGQGQPSRSRPQRGPCTSHRPHSCNQEEDTLHRVRSTLVHLVHANNLRPSACGAPDLPRQRREEYKGSAKSCRLLLLIWVGGVGCGPLAYPGHMES